MECGESLEFTLNKDVHILCLWEGIFGFHKEELSFESGITSSFECKAFYIIFVHFFIEMQIQSSRTLFFWFFSVYRLVFKK